jgi:hypothetical protein
MNSQHSLSLLTKQTTNNRLRECGGEDEEGKRQLLGRATAQAFLGAESGIESQLEGEVAQIGAGNSGAQRGVGPRWCRSSSSGPSSSLHVADLPLRPLFLSSPSPLFLALIFFGSSSRSYISIDQFSEANR